MKWAGNVARIGERRCVYRENLKEKDYLEEQGVDARITLRLIFRKWDGGA